MKKGFKLLKQGGISRSTQKIICHEAKEITRLSIGAIMLGGIIKEDWLKDKRSRMDLFRSLLFCGFSAD